MVVIFQVVIEEPELRIERLVLGYRMNCILGHFEWILISVFAYRMGVMDAVRFLTNGLQRELSLGCMLLCLQDR